MVFTVRYMLGICLVLLSCVPVHQASSQIERETEIPTATAEPATTTPTPNPTTFTLLSTTPTLQPKTEKSSTEDDYNLTTIVQVATTQETTTSETTIITEQATTIASTTNKIRDETTTVPNTIFSTTSTSIGEITTTEVSDAATALSNIIIEEAKENETKARTENARALDFDISKYTSPEFHSKNNVYNLPTSPDNEKYVDPDFDFTITYEVTTPSIDYGEVHQDLNHHRFDHETTVEELIDKAEHDDNSNLNIRKYTKATNDTKDANHTLHETESGLNVNFATAYNNTQIIGEEEKPTKSPVITNKIEGETKIKPNNTFYVAKRGSTKFLDAITAATGPDIVTKLPPLGLNFSLTNQLPNDVVKLNESSESNVEENNIYSVLVPVSVSTTTSATTSEATTMKMYEVTQDETTEVTLPQEVTGSDEVFYEMTEITSESTTQPDVTSEEVSTVSTSSVPTSTVPTTNAPTESIPTTTEAISTESTSTEGFSTESTSTEAVSTLTTLEISTTDIVGVKTEAVRTTEVPPHGDIDDDNEDSDEDYVELNHRKHNQTDESEAVIPVRTEAPKTTTEAPKITTEAPKTTTELHGTTEEDESVTESHPLEGGGDDESNSGVVIAIVISSIGAVCLVVLAGLLFVMRRRQRRFNYGQRCTPVSLDAYSMDNVSVYNSVRRKAALRGSKRSYGNPAFDDSSVTHPLNFQTLVKFATNLEDIKTEFEEIPSVTARMTELPEGCETKNRYANVIPLPETRVILSRVDDDPTGDYINANYITGPKGVRGYYIACQAPLLNTVNDFWRMIWEQQSKVVLMLTHLYENGMEKCIDYLPPSEVLDCHRLFGDYQVTLKKREVKDKYIISSLQLKNMVTNSWREVTHFWYSGWPEKGVPPEENSLITFLIEARSYVKLVQNNLELKPPEARNGNLIGTDVSPVVVHCSPGTGRTGTIIACDIAIREFELKRVVDIPKIVYRIRRDRANAVQTKDQYVFIYKVINLYATKLTGGALDSI